MGRFVCGLHGWMDAGFQRHDIDKWLLKMYLGLKDLNAISWSHSLEVQMRISCCDMELDLV
jgi:hypothetical protein